MSMIFTIQVWLMTLSISLSVMVFMISVSTVVDSYVNVNAFLLSKFLFVDISYLLVLIRVRVHTLCVYWN